MKRNTKFMVAISSAAFLSTCGVELSDGWNMPSPPVPGQKTAAVSIKKSPASPISVVVSPHRLTVALKATPKAVEASQAKTPVNRLYEIGSMENMFSNSDAEALDVLPVEVDEQTANCRVEVKELPSMGASGMPTVTQNGKITFLNVDGTIGTRAAAVTPNMDKICKTPSSDRIVGDIFQAFFDMSQRVAQAKAEGFPYPRFELTAGVSDKNEGAAVSYTCVEIAEQLRCFDPKPAMPFRPAVDNTFQYFDAKLPDITLQP